MNILVTGGCGFIGSNLCRRLLENNHNVICLDNCSSGTKKNINDLLSNSKFEFIRHDIVNPIYLEVDLIYHLACPASPKYYQHNPIKTVKTNVIGTLNILGLAKRLGVKVLLSSTSEVYGDPTVSPQNEDYWGNVNPNGIRSCYDEGKRIAETLFMEYNRAHNVDIKIVRIFNTYGPYLRKNDGRVVSNFICQALKNENITIYGNGNQTRSFCYINDLIDGLIRMMNSNEKGPINIGNDNEITVLKLAETVKEITNSESSIVFKELPGDDPKRRRPDLTRAKNLLKWESKINLHDGLKLTIDYFKNII